MIKLYHNITGGAAAAAVNIVDCGELHMIKGYEIERKFLVEFPDTAQLDVKRRISITQTYLNNELNGMQRRVRRIRDNDNVTFMYAEKLFLTDVTRQEMEYEINENEYERLLVQAKKDSTPVEKIRYCFEYKNQLFELDTYPFSDRLAIMEIELEAPEQAVDFPDNVNIIKEVTSDRRYANAALAEAGSFPE